MFGGYFVVNSYALYILQDYLGLGRDAVTMLPLFGLVGLPFLLLSTLLCGPLSDRIGRRKVFVVIASLLIGGGILVPLLIPSVTGCFVFAIISFTGLGMFSPVHQALMSGVLPSSESYGKDLGVVNIASTLPQVLVLAAAGAIVLASGGYSMLFPIASIVVVVSAVAVLPIRAVR